jgi:hypothetical protein
MTKNRDANGYRSEIAAAVHEMMSDAHDAGVVSRATLRSFDEACLEPAPNLDGAKIRAQESRVRLGTRCEASGWSGPPVAIDHPAQGSAGGRLKCPILK